MDSLISCQVGIINMKTRILLTRSMLNKDIMYIKNGLDKKIKDKYELIIPESFDEETLLTHIKDVEIILGPFITKRMIQESNKLKLMQVPWTGIDTVDINVIKKSNVVLCNSHSNSLAVAELGLTLTLDLLKKVTYHNNKLKNGNWNRDNNPLSLQSRMISNENIIILGCGHIGMKLANSFKVLGAKVTGFHEKDNCVLNDINILNMVELDNYIDKATVIISTLPLFEDTKHFINAKLISKLDNNCLIINMSRAEIVNEDDLYKALSNDLIGGFASDVWWNPPKRGETVSYVSSKYDFNKFENVIMSPHRAGFVENSLPHLDDAILNIINYVNEKPLINIIEVRK